MKDSHYFSLSGTMYIVGCILYTGPNMWIKVGLFVIGLLHSVVGAYDFYKGKG